ncbi:MAG TPA: hypothetical protein VL614_07935 [Acetobacteraceae bacterium]|jgi:hypothetical protein|nr:hypothetical protein [Acetobacteraceae bacterium]
MNVEKCTLVGATPEWRGDAPHPVPRRMLTIVLKGFVEITAGDGAVRAFSSGDVILAEDTWGTGHSARVTTEGFSLFIDISDDPAAPTS